MTRQTISTSSYSPARMTPALTLVASVVEVCGTASSRDFQVSVGQLVGGATQVLSASAAGAYTHPFSAQRKHFLWDTLGRVSVSVSKNG